MFSCGNLKCNNTKKDTVVKQKLLAALMIITLCVSGSASVMAAENESIMKDVTEEKQEAEDTFTEDNVSEKTNFHLQQTYNGQMIGICNGNVYLKRWGIMIL